MLFRSRMNFHDDLYVYDEATDALVYRPEPFTSEQVCEMVTCALLGINGDYKDLLFVLAFPLSMRAGLVHGYLSALQVSQPREAEVGLVALEYFVAPRLAQGLIDVPLAFADVPLAGAEMLPITITFENEGNRPCSRSRSRSKTS